MLLGVMNMSSKKLYFDCMLRAILIRLLMKLIANSLLDLSLILFLMPSGLSIDN